MPFLRNDYGNAANRLPQVYYLRLIAREALPRCLSSDAQCLADFVPACSLFSGEMDCLSQCRLHGLGSFGDARDDSERTLMPVPGDPQSHFNFDARVFAHVVKIP